ncbi:hypothetical protein CA54_51260 [Symmachiella macrocystis]|uniref:Uncharacterized protein n=1 Tax=Symmachiella macrocystis TaxID=2527985 RepID=A0A5C6B4Q2_9PLAN|nr:hypothetical protein CA54_51260 [Symmachiella macrocystis]
MVKPPIILYENGNVEFFGNLSDVICYVEPIDILNHEYVIYDSEGRIITLEVVNDRSAYGYYNLERVVLKSEGELLPKQLRENLIPFFARVLKDEGMSSKPLEELIHIGIDFFGVDCE